MSDKRTKLAAPRGITRSDVEAAFPNASDGFWKAFRKCKDYPWDEVQNALKQAREERRSSHESGISRKDTWLARDCQRALAIIKKTANPNGWPEPARRGDTVIDLPESPCHEPETHPCDNTNHAIDLRESPCHNEPLLQTNADDCGVLAIIAVFYETIGVGIEPTEIDSDFWRDILRQLLSPQSDVEHVPDEPQVNLSGLPANTRLSEVPGILSQCLRQPLDATKRKLASAEHALEMIRRAREGATKAGLPDVMARFQRVEDYCATEAGHFRSELELRQWIDCLPKV